LQIRKLGFLVACLVLVSVAFAACGKSSGNDSSGSTGESTGSAATPLSEVEDGKLTIGFSNYAGIIPFYQAMTAGVEEQAQKYGWSVDVTDSKFDPNKQVSDIQSLLTRGADVLVVSPGDQNALLPAYQEAASKGVPVISIANSLAKGDAAYETAFFGLSYEELFGKAAEALVKAMGGKGNVIQVNGPPGVDFVTESEAGVKRVFEENPGIKVVYSQNVKELSAAEGLRVAQAGLTANSDVQGAYANDDEIAVGMARALEQRGLAGKVPMAWSGGTAQAMDLAAKGELVGPVTPTYTWGTDVVKNIHEAVTGGKEFSGPVEPPYFELTSAKQAQELIEQCPEEPNQIWCLGR
jgi:ribose transport system substrate-binding protein